MVTTLYESASRNQDKGENLQVCLLHTVVHTGPIERSCRDRLIGEVQNGLNGHGWWVCRYSRATKEYLLNGIEPIGALDL